MNPAISTNTTGVRPSAKRRDEAERVVDRGADVAVGGREQGVDPEDSLKPARRRSAISDRLPGWLRSSSSASVASASASSSSSATAGASAGSSSAGGGCTARGSRAPPVGGRRGEDHPARRLGDHVAGDVAHVVLQRTAHPAEQRPAAHPRGLLGGEHDRLHPAAAGLAHDRLAGAASPHDRGGHLHALVLLPHQLGPRQRLAGALDLGVGERRVHRQRQRDLEHPDRLDHAPPRTPGRRASRRPGGRRSG